MHLLLMGALGACTPSADKGGGLDSADTASVGTDTGTDSGTDTTDSGGDSGTDTADSGTDTADSGTDTSDSGDTASVSLHGDVPTSVLELPDFSATNQDSEPRGPDALIGHPSVLWFYPAAGTSG